MYQIIVNSSGWDHQEGLLDASRIFEYTDDVIGSLYKTGSTLNLEKIRELPTIFASETGSSGRQIVKVGKVVDVQIINKTAHIKIYIDDNMPFFSNSNFEKILTDLSIDKFEISRNHWSIKNVNLYETLLRKANDPKELNAKLFNLADLYEPNRKLISVMMPFSGGFTKVYETFKECAKSVRMECLRADDIWDDAVVINDVVKLICNSRIVIADCTDRNPNVFYEIGIAHALGKEVILVTQNQSDIPFDLSHIRYIKYLNNEEGHSELAKTLLARIEKLIEND
jgi:hypothetical protein